MTTRRKYWLHISSTNQATSQVSTASSPQTARNFGLAGGHRQPDSVLLHSGARNVDRHVQDCRTAWLGTLGEGKCRRILIRSGSARPTVLGWSRGGYSPSCPVASSATMSR